MICIKDPWSDLNLGHCGYVACSNRPDVCGLMMNIEENLATKHMEFGRDKKQDRFKNG